MSDIIIKAENIGKRYVLSHQADGGGYQKFSDALISSVKAPFRWLSGTRSPGTNSATQEEFWALNDVSFEVNRGDVVGIIGRNGAGKSTLLKILSRITEPTRGRITLNGRVASLLEVGTGFHPELTGRENIFLNGAILGMTRNEIKAKFDEIVDFAEIEKFLDTPVKRYSSGMYVRLAFAVAAHLEPEILIVDEVLAVGDAQFQKKCLGKMKDVAEKGGRTVLFVSHNMAAVRAMCNKGILMERGRLIQQGSCSAVLETYVSQQAKEENDRNFKLLNKRINESTVVRQVLVEPPIVQCHSGVKIRFFVAVDAAESLLEGAVLLYGPAGFRVAIVDLRTADGPLQMSKDTVTCIEVVIQNLPLVEGDYDIGLYYRSARSAGDHLNLSHFVVLPDEKPTGVVPFAAQHRGVIELDCTHTASTVEFRES